MSIHIRVVGLVVSAIVASAAIAQTAVEWKVSEGGNGHWFRLVENPAGKVHWRFADAQGMAIASGAHLATFSDYSELAFVHQALRFVVNTDGAWIGLCQVAGSAEPSDGWRWVTGEPLTFTNWSLGQPDNSGCGSSRNPQDFACMGGPESTWDDHGDPSASCPYQIVRAVFEWSADCNGDAIIDYGQILRGELDDDNSNGIPDVCETSVTGVIPPSVPSQGGATVTIKGANFPDHPTVLIGGVAATDVVRLSATRITATSPALLPGMASISVNGFTLPEALYIRPECGSDLDQNGTVDTGDISIILLDFGPCYEPPSTFDAPAPTPLLLPDATTPAPTPPAPESARLAPQPRERSS